MRGFDKMGRNAAIAVITIIIVMTLSACGASAERPDTVPGEDRYSRELDGLIPESPFKWEFIGYGGYMHEMSISEVLETASGKTYKMAGSVADMSGGTSESDFSLAMRWMATKDSLIQEKESVKLMDSEFNRLTILRMPLSVGTSWEEKVKYGNGSDGIIRARITEVSPSPGGTSYAVEYDDVLSDYYEKRIIREGMGVVYFEKLLKLDGQSFPVSYSLARVNGNPLEDFKFEPKYEKDEDGNLVSKFGEDSKLYKAEAPQVAYAIRNYDNAWVGYVNSGSRKIFKYLVEGSKAYNAVKNFESDGVRQRFDKVEINKITFETRKRAKAIVSERIIKVQPGEDVGIEYMWMYSLKKADGEWRIDSYSEYSD
jgi:hypothetical protein